MPYEGLDQAALAARYGVDVELHETTASTLDIVHLKGTLGAASGALVLAEEQTAGRGRHGRRWISPPGAGIWLAMLLRPRITPSGGALAIRAGLEAVAALAEARPELEPRLKWPNDLMVRGRKAGGILCEARWSGETLGWVGVGIGINVTGPLPAGAGDAAIALDEVAPGLTRLAILDRLVPRLLTLERAPAELTAGERKTFRDVAWSANGADEPRALAPDGSLDQRAYPT